MKKLLFLLCLPFLGLALNAQTLTSVTMTKGHKIQINQVENAVQIDISALNFNNLQDAQRFFGKASSQFATFEASSTTQATVTLKTTDPKTSNWTASDWNSHFHYLSLKMNSLEAKGY